MTGKTGPEREEHFLRGQLRVRKASGRLSRARLALPGLLLLLVWIAIARRGAPELEIDRIFVEGNERLSEGEILELIEVHGATNILTLDLDETKRKLLRSAWVRDVELKRMLPATLTLQIVERTPVAVAALSELYLLAEDGTILDQLPPFYDMENLVLVRGLRDEDGGVSADRAALAGRMAEALIADERLALLVSELDVTEGADSTTLRLRESPLALLVSERTMVSRLSEVVPLLAGIAERLPRVQVLDLRFQNGVYVRLNQPDPGETQGSTLTGLTGVTGVIVPGGAPF
jgi:cell division septal protein FtsQ